MLKMPRIADYTAKLRLDSDDGVKSLKNFDSQSRTISDRVEKRFSSLSKSLVIAAPAVALTGITLLARNAANLEQRFNGVRKTTGLAGDELIQLKRNLLDFSTTTPVAVNELAGIATVAGQLGISGGEEIEEFAKSFARLQIASDNTISGELGAQQFARFLTLSGAGTENANRMASAFTVLGNTSKFTEGQLLSTASEVGKISSKFNLSAQATLGISAALTELGVAPEVAATSIQKFFGAVNSASLDGKGISELSTITGLTAKEIETLRETRPEQILDLFAKGLAQGQKDGITFTKQLKALGLNGERSIKTFGALTVDVDRLAEQIRKSNVAYAENNAVNKEAAVAGEVFNAEMIKLKNSFVSLGDSLASSGLLGFLSETVSLLNQIIKTTTAAIRAIKDLSDDPRENRRQANQRNIARPSSIFDQQTFEQFSDKGIPSRRTIKNLVSGSDLQSDESTDGLTRRERILRARENNPSQQFSITKSISDFFERQRSLSSGIVQGQVTNNTTNNITVNNSVETASNPVQAANIVATKTQTAIQQAAPQ